MAIFETKYDAGNKIYKRSGVIEWANGGISSLVPHEIVKVEISIARSDITGQQPPKVLYRTKNGDSIDERAAVAEKDVKAIAIAHLSSRLSAVADASLEAK